MQLLRAVNEILPALGEHTVTSVDAKHPTVAVILNALTAAEDDFLLRGWWFNTFDVTLYPDSERQIEVPVDALAVRGLSAPVLARGRTLFNPATLSALWDRPVQVRIYARLDFEELPESVARFILYDGCVQAYINDIGLEQVVGEWKVRRAQALATAESEHLRNAAYSTAKGWRFRRIRQAMRG